MGVFVFNVLRHAYICLLAFSLQVLFSRNILISINRIYDDDDDDDDDDISTHGKNPVYHA